MAGKHSAKAQDRRGSKRKRRVLLVIELLCIVIAIVCACFVVKYGGDYVTSAVRYAQIADETDRDVETLQSFYGDAVGWIYVEDTRIDYPVMYTPDDPEYYLHRTVEGDYSSCGTPFLGEGSNPDEATTNSMIVYAHHMRDGSMFGQLEKFESSTFAAEHVIVYTDDAGQHNYRVIAAWHEDLSGDDYYHYQDQVGTLSQEAFEQFVAEVTSRSLYSTQWSAAYGDRLLTLSTCSYGTSEERFVVVAVETDE